MCLIVLSKWYFGIRHPRSSIIILRGDIESRIHLNPRKINQARMKLLLAFSRAGTDSSSAAHEGASAQRSLKHSQEL
jgi:hypothetical protein